MDLQAVSEEIRTALDTIAGLRVPPWGAESIQPPAAVVTLPERIEFDNSYVRGTDLYPDLAVVLLVGRPSDRHTIKNLAPYVAGAGAKSVKAVLESFAWTACDSVTVEWCEFDVPKFAGTDYLAAIFHNKIIGRGA